MPLGPFDKRTKRSRCGPCSLSHLKCSGQSPCSNCKRRRVSCTYPGTAAKTALITTEKGKQYTSVDWNHNSDALPTVKSKAPPLQPKVDDYMKYLYFFDVFANRNNFIGRQSSFADEIKILDGVQSSSHLFNSMLALGALNSAKLETTDIASRDRRWAAALQFYSKALGGLRNALEGQHHLQPSTQATVLWTTLLLGLFELMNDITGAGWLRHMINGTSRALEALGPSACRQGATARFYVHARVFEVSRTILFNEPSFLTEPKWVVTSKSLLKTPEGAPELSLNSLLDIMVMCSHLRVRTISFLEHGELDLLEAHTICREGFALQSDLTEWWLQHGDPILETHCVTADQMLPETLLLARVFYAATSIYLSGIFDYEAAHWQAMLLAIPTLEEEAIKSHVESILICTTLGLKFTHLSPLLFLFPLRIAGARAWKSEQREAIIKFLTDISENFIAASAVATDLKSFWSFWGRV